MSAAPRKRWATLAGLLVVLACGADPPGAVSATGGSSGASGSSATLPVAGTAGNAMGGSAGQASAGGSLSPAAGAAGSSLSGGAAGATSGNAGTGGSASGSGGSAGTGGSASGAGGNAGSSGGNAGSAGTDPEGWVNIFNGQDLTGWVPLIHKSAYNQDPYKTFRVDPASHVIRITYVDYPGDLFDDRCGLLYYDKPLTNYRVRATYHFVDEAVEKQAKNAVGWGRFNSGLMIFGIDPSKVTGDPMFPPLIEIQLLGKGSSGGSTSPNICTPGGITYDKTADCGNNGSGVESPPPTTWVTVEAEVHPGAQTKVYTYPPGMPDRTKPIEIVTGAKYQNMAVIGGYLSLQSESQPCEFKDVQLIELP
ncbi:MAG TPA: DUF1080 domain-containing protein [Polyangiaceae bacterium]|nr:DUF1080 domain-containing protein [Polyangiaceae bacterium]